MYRELLDMCVNCNLVTPVTDVFADFLGVERRKYLVRGRDTYDLWLSDEYKAFCTDRGLFDEKMDTIPPESSSNHLYNYRTVKYFSVMGFSGSTTVVKCGKTLTLLEGKITVLAPLPVALQKMERWDEYLDMFDGEVTWIVPDEEEAAAAAAAGKS